MVLLLEEVEEQPNGRQKGMVWYRWSTFLRTAKAHPFELILYFKAIRSKFLVSQFNDNRNIAICGQVVHYKSFH